MTLNLPSSYGDVVVRGRASIVYRPEMPPAFTEISMHTPLKRKLRVPSDAGEGHLKTGGSALNGLGRVTCMTRTDNSIAPSRHRTCADTSTDIS